MYFSLDLLPEADGSDKSGDLHSLMEEISRENELKISQMSQEEIIAEQQQLAQSLGN